MSVTVKLAAVTLALAAATVSFGAQAALTSPAILEADAGPAIADAANYCVPRFGYGYRRGYGTIVIITGWNCPIAALPAIPRIGPDPNPSRYQRFDQHYR